MYFVISDSFRVGNAHRYGLELFPLSSVSETLEFFIEKVGILVFGRTEDSSFIIGHIFFQKIEFFQQSCLKF
jgi:hypothetical protein